MSKLQKIIFYLFAFLIFFVPIVLWPFTSEVFEFNKMVLVYALTSLIVGVWTIRCIIERRIIFRRTILDIPLLVFLGSQIISTLLSIDFYTSVFGYYSRFNGGLLSTVCYLLLYWAFVSNFDAKDTIKLVKIWFASGAIVSIYGILEHFGIDKNLWVQDVQSRVFSSLGQPNWLAAWLVALIPIAWALALNSKLKSKNFWIYFGLSVLFFWTLIFTKSRSGFLGFGIATVIFWGAVAWQNIKKLPTLVLPFLTIGLSFIVVCLISGTQWTPSLNTLINHSTNQPVAQAQGTALETGGTESGTIRKIVWTGALTIWLHYPIFGTGVETFAYSYYLYRPAAHNLTSEWDFIYNKAHNEFLNMAANSGSVGLLAYLVLIGFIIYQFVNLKNQNSNLKITSQNSKSENISDLQFKFELYNLRFALLAGFVSLSVSNFFGFSVVPTQLEFFLFPALAVTIANNLQPASNNQLKKLTSLQKIIMLIVVGCMLYVVFDVAKYWYADILYSRAKGLNAIPRPDLAIPALSEAIKLEPSQAIYYGELANSYVAIAMAYNQAKDASHAAQFTNLATAGIQKALDLSPANVNIRRSTFGIYVRLSVVEEKYLLSARDSLAETIKLAPTDAKLYFNLGIADANLGQYQAAVTDFQKAIELKTNYGDARVEYAALLIHLNQNEEAKKQLNYVLSQIDPNNTIAKQALANIK